MTYYVIRTMVKRLGRNTIEDEKRCEFERSAKMAYDELCREYPNDYFELVKIEHNEECLAYTLMDFDIKRKDSHPMMNGGAMPSNVHGDKIPPPPIHRKAILFTKDTYPQL